MPTEGVTVFNDELRGKIEFDNHRLDDQVLIKSDGYPTYHLANVVDDYLMKITHVIRAEEWISSTPKHVHLYHAFGWPEPKWVHLPLLRNADKSKISKRKNPVSLNYYRRAGYLPEALLNFLALMGWNPGGDVEVFDRSEMMKTFEIKDINLGDPVFDIVKLGWMNQQYLQKLDDRRFISILRDDFFGDDFLLKLKPLIIERLVKFEDFIDHNSFFFTGALKYDADRLIPKNADVAKLRSSLNELLEKLDDLYEWNTAELSKMVEAHREAAGLKPKEFLMPLRLIVTGRPDSPPLFETMEAVGREMVRFRIRNALETVLRV
jgi:glutamyl-tRNA synthetase